MLQPQEQQLCKETVPCHAIMISTLVSYLVELNPSFHRDVQLKTVPVGYLYGATVELSTAYVGAKVMTADENRVGYIVHIQTMDDVNAGETKGVSFCVCWHDGSNSVFSGSDLDETLFFATSLTGKTFLQQILHMVLLINSSFESPEADPVVKSAIMAFMDACIAKVAFSLGVFFGGFL